jgi:hypothetical protein
VTVALLVGAACMIGAIRLASGPEDAPELVTAWQIPPVTPSQVPVLREPRGSGDTDGSVAVAAEVAVPVQVVSPWQVSIAPATEAADGPAGSRAALVAWSGPDRASAAPGPVAAVEVDRTWQPPVPPVHDAVPVEVRAAPPATAASDALVVVVTDPWQSAAQSKVAPERDVDDGPVSACPATGLPVSGSIVR